MGVSLISKLSIYDCMDKLGMPSEEEQLLPNLNKNKNQNRYLLTKSESIIRAEIISIYMKELCFLYSTIFFKSLL